MYTAKLKNRRVAIRTLNTTEGEQLMQLRFKKLLPKNAKKADRKTCITQVNKRIVVTDLLLTVEAANALCAVLLKELNDIQNSKLKINN